jgi:hypothetical protein
VCSRSVHNRRHTPGAVRPARPARWSAEAALIFCHQQRVDAAVWIEPRQTRQPTVHDRRHAIDGERGLATFVAHDDLARS